MDRQVERAQRKDVVVRNTVAQLLESGSVVHGQLRRVTHELKIREGVLYYQDMLVVPKGLQQEVLERIHSETHFGQARTLRLLRRSYFWRDMTRHVSTFYYTLLFYKRMNS